MTEFDLVCVSHLRWDFVWQRPHSLRHSFAKRSLELGLQATWLQRQLGHSSLLVTTGIYGHWQRSERKREAAMLEGSFGFE